MPRRNPQRRKEIMTPLPSDEEITRVLATEVMGWAWDLYRGGSWLPSTEGPISILASDFQPLEDIAHAFMVVAKMRERRVFLTLHDCRDHFLASFQPLHSSRMRFQEAKEAPRAIAIAAIAEIKGTKK